MVMPNIDEVDEPKVVNISFQKMKHSFWVPFMPKIFNKRENMEKIVN